ncbi:unnamed protein product [Rhizophagus irregularis]|nr:unnamed protein product [Rhizophagus irregularis]
MLMKVRIERFKDSPDHSHPIEDKIVSAVKEIATETLDLGECVKELRWKEVTNITNIKYKVREPLDTHLVGDPKRELDIRKAISFLKNRGYLDIETHFFVSKEESETVAAGLKAIRQFAHCWNSRYFLSDQSNIESNAIKMAFLGLKNGEQECDVFFCTVHIMRTWMSKIYEKKIQQKMLHAMHKRTRIGCESLIQEAINECANPTIKKYILRNYAKNTHQWALWAR